MFAGSLVLGMTIIAFAAWLQWNENETAGDENPRTDLDREYLNNRGRARKRIHVLIAGSGGLVLVAACAGPGPVWLVSWLGVIMLLLIVVMLAGLDALRSHRYHLRKLPEIRREIFGDQEENV
ncbi:MAG: hypothetical protein AAGG48_13125 [Planctomycetota bacterium]